MKELLNKYESIILSYSNKIYDVGGDRRTSRFEIIFTQGSRLIAYESIFYDTERVKYSYQWMTQKNELIRRWDNAHAVPDIDTSPDHQHIGSESNIHPSEPMNLDKVLIFIALQLKD